MNSFFPWTFSEISVLVFIGSPLKAEGSWSSSLSCENVNSLSWNKSAFLSGFDLIIIFRALEKLTIASNTKSWRTRKIRQFCYAYLRYKKLIKKNKDKRNEPSNNTFLTCFDNISSSFIVHRNGERNIKFSSFI